MTTIGNCILCTDNKTSKSRGISFYRSLVYPQQQLTFTITTFLYPMVILSKLRTSRTMESIKLSCTKPEVPNKFLLFSTWENFSTLDEPYHCSVQLRLVDELAVIKPNWSPLLCQPDINQKITFLLANSSKHSKLDNSCVSGFSSFQTAQICYHTLNIVVTQSRKVGGSFECCIRT